MNFNLNMQLEKEYNTLIAGTVGSGKSVIINGFICHLLQRQKDVNLFLVDPKQVELKKYSDLCMTAKYANTPADALTLINDLIEVMQARYKYMAAHGLVKYPGKHIYLIIDELADLMLYDKKACQTSIMKLMQLSRAAAIHVIACTQCAARVVIPAPLQVNFTAAIALHCKSPIESRQIINTSGAEKLPLYGKAIFSSAAINNRIIDVSMIDDDSIQETIAAAPHKVPEAPTPAPEAGRHAIYNPPEETRTGGNADRPKKRLKHAGPMAAYVAAGIYILMALVWFTFL